MPMIKHSAYITEDDDVAPVEFVVYSELPSTWDDEDIR